MRVDKITLAALEATLRDGPPPVLTMITESYETVRARAERLASDLREAGIGVDVVDTQAAVGGGGAPTLRLPSAAISLPARFAEPLRLGAPPVVGRLERDRCLLDLRTVADRRARRAPRGGVHRCSMERAVTVTFVVATAGHVDHGKSALVRALTGMDTDRLDEERRRGLSIELGYAWTTWPTIGDVAFVDVPGHRRFVRTTLAGLGPVPVVLLVVAADEGWMPQSAEHLAALDLLEVNRGVLVITKIDRADPVRASAEARQALAATALADLPEVRVSAVDGTGINDLDRDAGGGPRRAAGRRPVGAAAALGRPIVLGGRSWSGDHRHAPERDDPGRRASSPLRPVLAFGFVASSRWGARSTRSMAPPGSP